MPNGIGTGSCERSSVFSPRLIFRTAFVTHEQILIEYSRYFVRRRRLGLGMFPYNQQPGGPGSLGTDKNAFQRRGDHLVLGRPFHEDGQR